MPISKKHLAILAPLIAVAGLFMMPTAAQAAPHYYENGVKLPEEAGPPEKENVAGAHPVIEWGQTIGFGVFAWTECHGNQFYAYVWNPIGGGPGREKITSWAQGGCHTATHAEEKTYPAEVTPEFPLKGTTGALSESSMAGQRRGTSLPWKGELCGPVENTVIESSEFINRIGLIAYGEGGDAIEGANCRKEATPGRTACYPHASGPVSEHRWQDIVEPEGAKTSAGTLVHGKGCIVLDFTVPEFLIEIVSFGTTEAEEQAGAGNALTPGRLNFHTASTEGIPSGNQETQEGTEGTRGTFTRAGEGLKLIGANGQQQVEVREP